MSDNLTQILKELRQENIPKNVTEDHIISYHNAELSFLYAYQVPGANIQAHAKVVLESKDLEWNTMFASKVIGADKEAHAKVVIDSKNLEKIYWFAIDVEGVYLTPLSKFR